MKILFFLNKSFKINFLVGENADELHVGVDSVSRTEGEQDSL